MVYRFCQDPEWACAAIESRDAFRAHFRDRFTRCTDLPLLEFRSYLADFPCLGAAEAASCEGVVTECELRDALKQVSRNKSRTRKEQYRGLVVSSASDRLMGRLGWSVEEVRSHWNLVPGSGFLNNSEFSLTWRLARNSLALNDWAYRVCIENMPDCPGCDSGLEEVASHAFYYCEWVRPF